MADPTPVGSARSRLVKGAVSNDWNGAIFILAIAAMNAFGAFGIALYRMTRQRIRS